MKKFSVILAYFILAGSFFVAPRVKALEITIDPGAVGTSFTEKTFSFNDFNNTNVFGQTFAIDFVFNDMKYITPEFNNNNPNAVYFYNIVLAFDHNLGGFPDVVPYPEGYLSDEDGSSILGSDTSSFNPATYLSNSFFGYTFSIGDPIVEGLSHFDIHMLVTLPQSQGEVYQITGASLTLKINGIGSEQLIVGAVPEPTTMLLFGTGLIGLAGLRFRRKK